jgi:hypothetical protein
MEIGRDHASGDPSLASPANCILGTSLACHGDKCTPPVNPRLIRPTP